MKNCEVIERKKKKAMKNKAKEKLLHSVLCCSLYSTSYVAQRENCYNRITRCDLQLSNIENKLYY